MATDLIAPVLAGIVGLVAEQLATDKRPVSLVIPVYPGIEPALDQCCGMLYSRVVGVTPTNARGPMSSGCGILEWRVTAAIGVVRCAAVVNDQGIPPSAQQITNDGVTMLNDRASVEQVLLTIAKISSISDWRPLMVLGGCMGGEWTFTFTSGVCRG